MFRLGSIILLAGLVGPCAAWAGEDRDDLSSDITSLNYYPHKGHFYLYPRDTQALDDHSSNSNGTQTMTFSNAWTLSFSHGFGNGLRGGFSEGGIVNNSVHTTNANGTTNVHNSFGVTDPSLFLNWRFLPTTDSGWSADLDGTLTPSLAHKKAATNRQSGNDYNGYWAAAATGNLFWRRHSNEVGTGLTLSQHLAGNVDGDAANNTYSTDPVLIPSAAVNDRYHFNADWFIEPGVAMTLPYNNHSTYDSGTTTTDQFPFRLTSVFIIGWRLAPRTLLSLDLNYSHYAYTRTQPGAKDLNVDVAAFTGDLGLVSEF
jgi:hypothetical protein